MAYKELPGDEPGKGKYYLYQADKNEVNGTESGKSVDGTVIELGFYEDGIPYEQSRQSPVSLTVEYVSYGGGYKLIKW